MSCSFATPFSFRESIFRSLCARSDDLLRERNLRRISKMYPDKEPLKRCEPEQDGMILFFAKGCKIPEYLEDKPYQIIREGRLIKVS